MATTRRSPGPDRADCLVTAFGADTPLVDITAARGDAVADARAVQHKVSTKLVG